MLKKVSEIIDLIQEYHLGLGQYYISLKSEVQEERVILLLDFLSKDEFFIAEYLEKYKKDSSNKVLERWVKYVPWLPTNVFCKCREELHISPPLLSYDVLEISNHFDQCLIDFYTALSWEIRDKKTQDVFSNLLKVAKKHEMNLSRDVAWLYDL